MNPENYKLFLLSQYFPKDLAKIILDHCPNPSSEQDWFLLFMESNNNYVVIMEENCKEPHKCCIKKCESGFNILYNQKQTLSTSNYEDVLKTLPGFIYRRTMSGGRQRGTHFESTLKKNFAHFMNTWKQRNWDFLFTFVK